MRGADRRWVVAEHLWLPCVVSDSLGYSALENALRKHATSSSSSAAFSGAGRTLGGDPAPKDVGGGVKNSVNQATAKVTNLDPQVRVFLGLLGAYLVFWYLSS